MTTRGAGGQRPAAAAPRRRATQPFFHSQVSPTHTLLHCCCCTIQQQLFEIPRDSCNTTCDKDSDGLQAGGAGRAAALLPAVLHADQQPCSRPGNKRSRCRCMVVGRASHAARRDGRRPRPSTHPLYKHTLLAAQAPANSLPVLVHGQPWVHGASQAEHPPLWHPDCLPGGAGLHDAGQQLRVGAL